MRTLNLPPDPPRKPRKKPYRKPQSIKELEAMEMEAVQKKFPGLPYPAPRYHRDDSANGLTKAIIRFIELNGGFVTRLTSEGSWRPNLQRWIPSTQKKGLPDIYALFKSQTIFIEVKIGKDRLSIHQEQIKDQVQYQGAKYFIARDFTTFKNWFDNLI